jgi:hypothetical protein
MKIYVASSWRNIHQPEVVAALRSWGHDVYDFRAPEPGNTGFRWSDIDPEWKIWGLDAYAKALDHPIAQHGFELDMRGLISADLCVLVLPSGRSASWEYGYHCGMTGRQGIVYVPEDVKPELMYRGAMFAGNFDELKAAVAIKDEEVRRREVVFVDHTGEDYIEKTRGELLDAKRAERMTKL